MRVAFADPPYPGRSRYYPEHREVDSAALIATLIAEFPDGWALCTTSPALSQLLPVCPPDVRVLSWVKPFAVFKPGIRVAYAWEPVLFRGGRPRSSAQPTVRDWHMANVLLNRGCIGAKPVSFCRWLLDVWNVQTGDEVIDLFPGTGVMGRVLAQDTALAQQPLRLELTR